MLLQDIIHFFSSKNYNFSETSCISVTGWNPGEGEELPSVYAVIDKVNFHT